MEGLFQMDMGALWKKSGFGFGVDRFWGEWVWEHITQDIMRSGARIQVDLSGLPGFTRGFIVSAFCGGVFPVEETLERVTFISPGKEWRAEDALETLQDCL